MPLPNNFRFGDGLNTAGFTWQRPETEDFDHLSLKFDHSFNESNQLAFSYTRERRDSLNAYADQLSRTPSAGMSGRKARFTHCS